MPALDPLAASARPMLPFNSLPSEPLPFGATLRPVDQNVLCRLPKPRKYKDTLPLVSPLQYTHSRHSSFDIGSLNHALVSRNDSPAGSDEWMEKRVGECVNSAKGVLDISNCGLTRLSTKISEIQHLVTLPPSFSPRAGPAYSSPRAVTYHSRAASPSMSGDPTPLSPNTGPLAANSPGFSRVVSAPASAAFFNRHSGTRDKDISTTDNGKGLLSSPTLTVPTASDSGARSPFSRSRTNAPPIKSSSQTRSALELLVSNNALTILPSALFELSNLTVLSLRANRLTELPAAIGSLTNLVELSISNNQITELPSTILNLNLSQFHVQPNPLRRPDNDTNRKLGPLARAVPQTVPRLYDICLNLLLSPRPDLPPLLGDYDWAPVNGEPHPLLHLEVLHEMIPCIGLEDMRRVMQMLQSAGFAYTKYRDKRTDIARLGIKAAPSARVNPFPHSGRNGSADNAAQNPYFYPCPSPYHLSGKRFFLHAAETRLEWRDVFGYRELPIRWQGCSPGCLKFLEEDDDDWSVDGEDELWL